jgi:hypothetical protein
LASVPLCVPGSPREKKAPWSGEAYRLGESEENVGENPRRALD